MIDKEKLKVEVIDFLRNNHNLDYEDVEFCFETIFNNWIHDLEVSGSHITTEDLALFMYQMKEDYGK